MAEISSASRLGRWRAPNPLVIALLLSLTLNVFAVGGYAYSKWQTSVHPAIPSDHRLALLAVRLGLNAEQQGKLDAFLHSLHSLQGALDQQNHPLMEQAWAELTKPEIDLPQVQQLLEEMSLHRHAFETSATVALVQFIESLTPDQKAAFAKTVLDRKDPAGSPIRNNIGN